MSKFTDYIDALVDDAGKLAKDELKALIKEAKADPSDFVRLQAQNIERWTEMLASGDLTADGYKKLVKNMEVLTQLENIKLKVKALASAQRLAGGLKELVIEQMFKLI